MPPENTESQVLRPRRTAATRATKHYRGKKNKSSSPVPSDPPSVDYDEVPDVLQPSDREVVNPGVAPEEPKLPDARPSKRRAKPNVKPEPDMDISALGATIDLPGIAVEEVKLPALETKASNRIEVEKKIGAPKPKPVPKRPLRAVVDKGDTVLQRNPHKEKV